MKLISCYIEGYGKIKRKEYTFSEGITTIFGENGEGKTTLASFIKAMFYGLKGYKKTSTEFCDREHFFPFDGGLFGGNLTFEMGGDVYKIERFFGEKSETADTLKVYKNGERTEALGAELGKTVFGVDRESFERTTFFGSGEIEIASTSGIHAQLNRFLEGGGEDGSLDSALATLEKAAKVYKKSKTGNDKLSLETAKIAQLTEGIENSSAIKFALEEKYRRAQTLSLEIKEVNEQILAAQKKNERLTQFEHYDSLAEGISAAKADLQNIAIRYPHGLPSIEETEEVNAYMVREKELNARLEGMEFTPADEEKWEELRRRFQVGVPSEESLEKAEGMVKELATLQTQARLLCEHKTGEEETRLREKFSKGTPTAEALEHGKHALQEYKDLHAERKTVPAWVQEEEVKKLLSKRYLLLIGVALSLILPSLVFILQHNVFGYALLGLGGMLLFVVGFLYLNKKVSGKNVALMTENPEHKILEGHIERIERILQEQLFAPYGYDVANGVEFNLVVLQSDLAAYDRLLRAEVTRRAEGEALSQQAKALEERLTAFFAAHGLFGETHFRMLSVLRADVQSYAELSARKNTLATESKGIAEEVKTMREKIYFYRGRYALSSISVGEILADIQDYKRLEKEILEGENKVSAYREEKGLETRESGEKVDLRQLQELLSEKQTAWSKLEREITEDEREAEKLEEYETEKREAEARLKEYKRKYKLLSATAELMNKADGQLRDKYVKPVKDEFLRHAELIERALGEKLVMTKNFDLRFERNGIERSEKHLSSGQRSVCALCFRLALIKNMYQGQLPFLVLDDPFTSLDEGHLSKVKEVLKSLSDEMQMIYFTCHESRVL